MDRRIIQLIDDDHFTHGLFEQGIVPELEEFFEEEVELISCREDNWVDDFRKHFHERFFAVIMDYNLGPVDGGHMYSYELYRRMIHLEPSVLARRNVISLSASHDGLVYEGYRDNGVPPLLYYVSKPIIGDIQRLVDHLEELGF